MGAEPRASRPAIRGYGIPEGAEGLRPWSWARDRLQAATTYWVASTRPDGRPHLVPTWGAWVDDRFYFEGGRGTRRARNLETNPEVAVSVEDGDTVIVVEGPAADIAPPGDTLAARILAGFAKYRESHGYEASSDHWRDPDGALWELRPRVAFGWSAFPSDATRWHFASGPTDRRNP